MHRQSNGAQVYDRSLGMQYDYGHVVLVGEHSVKSEGRPRGLLNVTEETLPA